MAMLRLVIYNGNVKEKTGEGSQNDDLHIILTINDR